MSDFENIPLVSNQPVEAKVPHSGDVGIDFPVVEGLAPISEEVVNSTKAPDTVTEGLGEQDSVSAGEKATWDQARREQALTNARRSRENEQPFEAPKKSKKGLWAIGAGVTSLLVAGGALLGVNAAKDNGKTEALPPESTPTVSAPVTPGAAETTKPTAAEKAPAVSIYELKAGQTPEELAKSYQDLTTAWVNAGCTPDLPARYLAMKGVTPEKFGIQIATEEGQKYAIGLLGTDYESNPALKAYADNMIALNAKVINLYIRTAAGGGGFGYEQRYAFDSLTSSAANNETTTIAFEGHVNDNGSAFPNVVKPGPNSQKISYSLTFTKSGVTEKLTQSIASDPR